MPFLDMDHWTGAQMLWLIAGHGLAGLAAGLLWPRRAWVASLCVGAVLPVLVLINVLVGVLKNPKSHNLWPIEIAIVCVLSVTPALVGAATGSALRRLFRRPPAGTAPTPASAPAAPR